MTDRPPVTVYWRPGCGFCHILRRELDRAGVERTEIDIWQDPAAAAVVRSHARGNETVPTVLVGDLAMVNPNAAEVIAAQDRLAGTPDAALPQPGLTQPPRSGSPWFSAAWPGAVWSGAACAAWAGLALANPTTTYHLAPVIGLLAWPVIARERRHRAEWRSGLLATAGASAMVALTTLVLLSREALDGPALIGPNAAVETATLAVVAALAALTLARPHRRSAAAPEDDSAAEDQTGVVTVVGSGGGCTTTGGASDVDSGQCGWAP